MTTYRKAKVQYNGQTHYAPLVLERKLVQLYCKTVQKSLEKLNLRVLLKIQKQ